MLREVGDKIAGVAAELMNIFSATVTTDSVPPGETTVALDTAPDISVPARSIGGRLEKGARVMCLAYPPRGLLILGRTDEAPAITAPYLEKFDTPGITVWNKPAGLVAVRVRVVGGGGSGGAAPAAGAGTSSMGGGGQGGMYCESWLSASAIPDTVNIQVSAQAIGTVASATSGGTSAFHNLVIATGGFGGVTLGAGATVTLVSGGSGFVAGFAGQIVSVGNDGQPGIRLTATTALGGNGGGSMLGGGGRGSGTSALSGGWNYGGGGGGAASGGAALAGGPGAQGVVLLEYVFAP